MRFVEGQSRMTTGMGNDRATVSNKLFSQQCGRTFDAQKTFSVVAETLAPVQTGIHEDAKVRIMP